ncbi:hypothetical protein LCGC14_3064090, partial [marine sediment metagenome]
LGLCKSKDGRPCIFKDKSDPDYQIMLKALQFSHESLMEHPRVDMIDGVVPTTPYALSGNI